MGGLMKEFFKGLWNDNPTFRLRSAFVSTGGNQQCPEWVGNGTRQPCIDLLECVD